MAKCCNSGGKGLAVVVEEMYKFTLEALTPRVGQMHRTAMRSAHRQHKKCMWDKCASLIGSISSIGKHMAQCACSTQVMHIGTMHGMSWRLCMVVAKWHAWDASCGEGNVSGRVGSYLAPL
ncbi:hypothetical protein L3X38_004237 [Prunus dulcis]|uniref:Uncharacterized protein n=1 Tax=Prunus dulcis TaxID=3755 RepID=A0AAD5F2Y0_PRUDU|nr:hypothetical protein L3X38_004237 [Prunus dulcis]